MISSRIQLYLMKYFLKKKTRSAKLKIKKKCNSLTNVKQKNYVLFSTLSYIIHIALLVQFSCIILFAFSFVIINMNKGFNTQLFHNLWLMITHKLIIVRVVKTLLKVGLLFLNSCKYNRPLIFITFIVILRTVKKNVLLGLILLYSTYV